ncbi:hypothetical protein ACO0LB_13795 [Undibacterium sp. SXout7W]|uniref:hypothetical protein n=1 Tax=Undibacterium sp. SXout7W TaxID=3413049 RepID=UPI003BF2E9DF
MKKILCSAGLAMLLLPIMATAQVSVFKCELDGRVIWSDNPCKVKGKVVRIKDVQSGNRPDSATDNRAAAPKTPPVPKSESK